MVEAISSPENEKVKYLRSLRDHRGRQRARHYLIEGIRLVEEALLAGSYLSLVLVDEESLARTPRGQALVEQLARLGALPATARALQAASATLTPQGVVAAVQLPERPRPAAGGATTLVLDGVSDPGNLGTILRTSEAAGARPVLLAPGTADAFAPKVVRAGMGAHFRLPLVSGDWLELRPYLVHREVWLAEAGAGTAYYEVDWLTPSAVIIGSEANGFSAEARQLATRSVTIPMQGPSESLNAAIAAAVLLFEALRQRTSIVNRPRRRE